MYGRSQIQTADFSVRLNHQPGGSFSDRILFRLSQFGKGLRLRIFRKHAGLKEKGRISAYTAIPVIDSANVFLAAIGNAPVLQGLQTIRAAKAAPQGPGASAGRTALQSAFAGWKDFRIMRFPDPASFTAPGGKPHPELRAVIAAESRENPAGAAENIRGFAAMSSPNDIPSAADEIPICMLCVFTLIYNRISADRTIKIGEDKLMDIEIKPDREIAVHKRKREKPIAFNARELLEKLTGLLAG